MLFMKAIKDNGVVAFLTVVAEINKNSPSPA
jgi:hypothetical protein